MYVNLNILTARLDIFIIYCVYINTLFERRFKNLSYQQI
jgi:hypothetical protein